MHVFVYESVIPASVEEVFAFHEDPRALSILMPPWEKARVITPPNSLAVGTVVEVETRIGPFWTRMVAEHIGYEKNRYFEDTLRKSPFASWRHHHGFSAHPEGCLLRDEIHYRLPLGPLGQLVEPLLVRPRLQKLFRYRHEITRQTILSQLSASPAPAASPDGADTVSTAQR